MKEIENDSDSNRAQNGTILAPMEKGRSSDLPCSPKPAQLGLKSVRVAVVADNPHLGDIGAFRDRKNLVDQFIAGMRVGPDVQFGERVERLRLVEILTQSEQVDRSAIPQDAIVVGDLDFVAGRNRHLPGR